MKLIWTKEALERLDEIYDFIAQDNPQIAEKFVHSLIERSNTILQYPEIGRIVPEIANPKIRELITKKYRIVYMVKNDGIEILTVFEGHMLLRIDEIEIDSGE